MENPRKTVTVDGNEAAAYCAYAMTEVAAIYPITPSSPMAGKTDAWAARGKKNIFGQEVTLVEMESEAGAAAAVHGALETGSLAASFTSSQGLMLMIPVMHRLSGQRHPAVLHVASRTVGTHAFSIFGDHSDVMNCRTTGFAMLSTGSVQEVMDLAGVAHLSAIKTRVPFMHFFDGFRTSHEIDKVEQMPYEFLSSLLDLGALAEWRAHALNPEHPLIRSTVQNPDIYFQVRESTNPFYDAVPDVVEDYMKAISDFTGREYHLFNYYGAPDADRVIIAMGSVAGTVRETVDWLNSHGEKVGFVQVHLFRPFSVKHLMAALPATVCRIAVLDRTKEQGSAGEPLYQDICTAFTNKNDGVQIYGGRYGLSSKDTDPAQIKAVYDNLALEEPKDHFTVGIDDDVTHLSLPVGEPLYPDADRVVSCKFWGLGSDGTVGANHSTVGIINEHTKKYAQAYFEYDAKKSFGVTKSHLRFGDEPIRSTYYVKSADFVAVHNESYILRYDIADEVREGGSLLLNCVWGRDELGEKLPARVRKLISDRHIAFYTINATEIASRLGLGGHVNLVLQAAFFAIAKIMPVDEAVEYMKEAARKTYFAKGDEVVAKNLAAIDEGVRGIVRVDVPQSWGSGNVPSTVCPERPAGVPAAVTKLLDPINDQKGDELPVSAFKGYEDGVMDMGMTAWEKRSIAVRVPVWDSSKCLQCNNCAFVCPHAVIRPYLLTDEEISASPAGFETVPAKGKQAAGLQYSLLVSDADCTGCGSCVNACPAAALKMVPCDEAGRDDRWDYALTLADKDLFDKYTVKGSQFRSPLVEFSAACAGCGETPYAKLLTQLFGDRMYWANATGCSQAWGSPMPGIPYTTDKNGHGPAWSNSLFENNAEFSLGMELSVKKRRARLRDQVTKLLSLTDDTALNTAAGKWLSSFDDLEASTPDSEALKAAVAALKGKLTGDAGGLADDILAGSDCLAKKTFWMFGGDGWAYDIGFGGLDHVLAQGEDVNILIVDTEIYSNTGGQSSKATPVGAVAQFASSGKKSPKKDLGAILMTYGNVYVASVAMGADKNQLLKAIREAEAFKGPSVIIAYAPCTGHGLKCGMAKVQDEMKKAVDAGYWFLYRFDPSVSPRFTLDSKKPALPYGDFLSGEVRYDSLTRTFPDNAERLFAIGAQGAAQKYEDLLNRKD